MATGYEYRLSSWTDSIERLIWDGQAGGYETRRFVEERKRGTTVGDTSTARVVPSSMVGA